MMKSLYLIGLCVAGLLACLPAQGADSIACRAPVQARVQEELPSLVALYQHLHAHPELSFQEVQTAARIAEELRKVGCTVTTGVGKQGVVGVLRKGTGPTILVRTDLDALPVQEQTGLPYASTVTATNAQGETVPVMHACGHDIHMACLVGTARVLARLTNLWHGTLLFIGQPAEEFGGGARAMIEDGLFERFPRPDFCLALHDSADLAAGTLGYTPGYSGANVDSVDILVQGVGGHGAHPDKTKDPIVLAAQIILALQTIVSREVEPGDPAVVTVGTIHGGTRRNIIPDEVRLELTVRSYSDAVRQQVLADIKRIVRGQAIAAGVPKDRLPKVRVAKDFCPALYNTPELTDKVVGVLKAWFGETNLLYRKPSMGGEDFSEFGRVTPKIPICMFNLGGVRPEVFAESQRTHKALPSLHSSLWAPDPEPTIKTGVTAMSAAVLNLASP